MGVGSVIGAVAGELLLRLVPAAALKLVLGVILIVSAVRTFRDENPKTYTRLQDSVHVHKDLG